VERGVIAQSQILSISRSNSGTAWSTTEKRNAILKASNKANNLMMTETYAVDLRSLWSADTDRVQFR
jgi:hypothetical protein